MVPSYFSGKSGQNMVGQLTRLKLAVKARQLASYGPMSSLEVVALPVGKPEDACSSTPPLPHSLSRAVRASSLAFIPLR